MFSSLHFDFSKQAHVWAILWGSFFASLSAQEDGPYGAAEFRNFRNHEGKEIRARLMSVKDGKVVLRSSLGREFITSKNELSDEDQGYIEEWNPHERLLMTLEEKGLESFLKDRGFSEMPFQVKEEKMVVSALVNGRAVDFDVDPGRFLTILNKEQALAADVEMSDIAYGDFPLPKGGMETVFGGTFATFVVGEAKFGPWDMGIADLPRIGFDAKGLLGADFFHLNDAVIDWKESRVFLKTAKDSAPAEGLIPKLREFTDLAGRTLTGEWVSRTEDQVRIRTDGGKEVDIALSSLSPEDQEYLDLWNTDPGRNGLAQVDFAKFSEITGKLPVTYDYGNSTVAAFEMNLNGQPLRFLLNTTLPSSYLSVEAAAKTGLNTEETPDRMMIGDQVVPVGLVREVTLGSGGEKLAPFDFRVIELAPGGKLAAPVRSCMIFRFPELAARFQPFDVDGILGLDWVMKHGAVVDYLSQAMFVDSAD